MADGNLDDSGKRQRPPSYLDRPIHKLALLLTADEVFQEYVFHEETREVPHHRGANEEQLKDVARVSLSMNIVVNT